MSNSTRELISSPVVWSDQSSRLDPPTFLIFPTVKRPTEQSETPTAIALYVPMFMEENCGRRLDANEPAKQERFTVLLPRSASRFRQSLYALFNL